ncbi:hypothetical protein [Streptomyces virginiae]|uniref:hypothetical protein n=1 Tax=Streptomyces virginiae TaxID=1961 RepID=UPI0034570F15
MAGIAFAPPSAAHDPARPAGAGQDTRDPLVAARTAFFTGSGWTAHLPGPGHDGRLPDAQGELATLLEAEYGLQPRAVPPGERSRTDRRDKAVAGLRRAARLGVPLTPEALLAHREWHPRLLAVVTELWPETVRWYGHRHAEEVLRATLGESRDGPGVGHLLDLAVAAGLRPLTPLQSASLARTTSHRAVRHSAWRYLRQLPGGPAQAPHPSEAGDA